MNPFKRIVIVLLSLAIPSLMFSDLSDSLNHRKNNSPTYAHGGGLNACGCHFNRKTGECHCHRDYGCGCECEPARCKGLHDFESNSIKGNYRILIQYASHETKTTSLKLITDQDCHDYYGECHYHNKISTAQETGAFQDEKTALLNSSYYGDFRNAKKIKKTGNVVLEIWSDRAQHIKKRLGYSPEINKLTVAYDEIWERKVDDFLSEEEKRKSRNDLDISKIYWKQNKVQASTLERKFSSNPLTGEKFSVPIYEIIELDDRSRVLKNLGK
ncbi:MAG: hypothetical protein WBD99_08220 [Thermodesulfobacteriota bacterium]